MDKKHSVLIISNRTLVAEGLVSLLEHLPGIGEVQVAESLYEARYAVASSLPDALLIDLPAGADYFIDRPMEVEGREVKTIVMQDDAITGEARLYVHSPALPANLQNLSAAIFSDPAAWRSSTHDGRVERLTDAAPAVPVSAQPTSLMRASASGPSSSRISSSRRGV